jgi:hypothetical protein
MAGQYVDFHHKLSQLAFVTPKLPGVEHFLHMVHLPSLVDLLLLRSLVLDLKQL